MDIKKYDHNIMEKKAIKSSADTKSTSNVDCCTDLNDLNPKQLNSTSEDNCNNVGSGRKHISP